MVCQGIGQSELRGIEKIKDLRPQLNISSFCKLKILEDGKVEIVLSWPTKNAAAGVTENMSKLLAWRQRRNPKRTRVVPTTKTLMVRGATETGGIGKVVRVADHIRARVTRTRIRPIKRKSRSKGRP